MLMRVFLIASVSLLSCAEHASSFFEEDDEGWTVQGNGGTRPTLVPTGGNQRGHLCAVDSDPEDFYFAAPSKFYGNVSQLYGTKLTFDIKIDRQFSLRRGRDVILAGGGLALAQDYSNFPGPDWTPRLGSVRLDADSRWKLDRTEDLATEEQVRTVLRNLTSIRIRGDYADGAGDGACIDNVKFGTP